MSDHHDSNQRGQATEAAVRVVNPAGVSPVVLICEHASPAIPEDLAELGLAAEARMSHVAWDPGAEAVAERMAARLDAVLVAGVVSRLVYDLNRAPDAPDAMPARSEIFDIPGNAALDAVARAERVARYYTPFHDRAEQVLTAQDAPVVVTVHSFTPVYHGKRRAVEIGVLHDSDARLADAMLATAAAHTDAVVERNAPYGPGDNVMHSLRRHGETPGRLHVMLEVRNDLIATPEDQAAMGEMIAAWVADACTRAGVEGVTCKR